VGKGNILGKSSEDQWTIKENEGRQDRQGRGGPENEKGEPSGKQKETPVKPVEECVQ